MAGKPKASIRKAHSGQWRGYIGDIRVAEFQSESDAKQWLAAPTNLKAKSASSVKSETSEPVASVVAQTIKIDTEGISDEQKTTDKFKSAYHDMMAQLLVPSFIPVLCAHEAAHMLYFGQLGVTEFEPLLPRLRYSAEKDDYVGHLAAMQPKSDTMRVWQPGHFSDWFIIVACAYAAGGVVARTLMPSSDGGDQDDKDRFKKLCDEFNKDPNVKINFDEWWEVGQKNVAEHIKNQEFLAIIQQEASKLRPLLGLQ
jgi:hypothetical protein